MTWILAESLGLNNFCCRHARDLWFEPVAAGLYCIARTFFRSEIEKILKFVFKFKFKFELPAQKDVSDLRRSGSIKTENCLWNTMNALIYWSSSLRGLFSSSSWSLPYSWPLITSRIYTIMISEFQWILWDLIILIQIQKYNMKFWIRDISYLQCLSFQMSYQALKSAGASSLTILINFQPLLTRSELPFPFYSTVVDLGTS